MSATGRALRRRAVVTGWCALVALGVAGTANGANRQNSATVTNGRAPVQATGKILVLSVRYGKFRPAGAPRAYTALQITARATDGQIVSVAYRQTSPAGGGGGVIAARADAPCGLGGEARRSNPDVHAAARVAPGPLRLPRDRRVVALQRDRARPVRDAHVHRRGPLTAPGGAARGGLTSSTDDGSGSRSPRRSGVACERDVAAGDALTLVPSGGAEPPREFSKRTPAGRSLWGLGHP